MTNLDNIDCERAVADNDDDREAFLACMKKDAGCYHATCSVTKAVRDWLGSGMNNRAQELPPKLEDGQWIQGFCACRSLHIIVWLLDDHCK